MILVLVVVVIFIVVVLMVLILKRSHERDILPYIFHGSSRCLREDHGTFGRRRRSRRGGRRGTKRVVYRVRVRVCCVAVLLGTPHSFSFFLLIEVEKERERGETQKSESVLFASMEKQAFIWLFKINKGLSNFQYQFIVHLVQGHTCLGCHGNQGKVSTFVAC